ncbi:MAG: DUF4252 domain-containing protein [Tannerella sp.]|nr:DUF4252 domain-containing protein [Tannerella sp.]
MNTKTLLLAACLLCCGIACAQESAMNRLFDKYGKDENVVVISISKAMFKLIPDNVSISKDHVDIKSIVNKIESMRLITTSNTALGKKIDDEIRELVDRDGKYEELMRIRDGKSAVTFCVRKNGELIGELIMLIDEEKEFVVICIAGSFTLEEIQEIAAGRNVQ